MKSKLNTYCTVFFLAAVCIFAVPVSVSASPYTNAVASTEFTSNVSPGYDFDYNQQHYSDSTPSTARSVMDHFVTGYYNMTGAASASAEIGRIRLFAIGSALATYHPLYVAATVQSFAQASWGDSFTLDGGALNGRAGHLIAGFSVDGSLRQRQ